MKETALAFEMQTLTPVWTGNAVQQCDRLHETGLLGSLRWWFEVVVRGLGRRACDPTADGKCEYKEKDGVKGLCAACRVFGATGWRKLFRLEVDLEVDEESTLQPIMDSPEKSLLLPSGRYHDCRAGGWYILPAHHGTFSLKFHRRRVGGKEEEELFQLLLGTLRLIENWAAIGAKETAGYGVFEIVNSQDFKLPEQNPLSESQEASDGESDSGNLPDLTGFFFAKVRFRPSESDWWKKFKEVALALDEQPSCSDGKQMQEKQFQEWLNNETFPLSPIVRNWLRYTWFQQLKAEHLSLPKEELLFGTVRGDRRRTAIGISHAYQVGENLWEFRLWGHRPPGLKKKKWQEFVDRLCQAVKPPGDQAGSSAGSLPTMWSKPNWKQEDNRDWRNEGGLFGGVVKPVKLVWREFNSERDTVKGFSDEWQFFKSLVREEEKNAQRGSRVVGGAE